MKEWKSAKTCLSTISIHYYWTGCDKPVLVLSHGLGDDALCWTPVARELTNAYDLVLLDTRGHGFSDAPQKAYGTEERARDIVGVIQNLGLQQVTLMGHSWGAQASLFAAAYEPTVVRSVILEDPPFVLQSDKVFHQGSARRIKEMYRNTVIFKVIPKPLARKIYKNRNPRWSDEEVFYWAEAKRRLSWNLVAYIHNMPVYDLPEDIFAKVRVPILLITGNRELGGIISSEAAQKARSAAKSLTVANIKNAGHSIRREEFLQYNRAVVSFLSDQYL